MRVILLSATYQERKALLKFYHPQSNRVILVKDNTDHKPHCYVSLTTAGQIQEWDGVEDIEYVRINDVIKGDLVKMGRVIAKDPLVIGGNDDSLRERFPTWESDIKYYQTYLYDRGLVIGKWYEINKEGKIIPAKFEENVFDLSGIEYDRVVEKDKFEAQLKKWSSLLGQPIPSLRRVAFDIEVESTQDKIPDATEANNRVTAISFCSSDNLKKVFVLKRPEVPEGEIEKDVEYEQIWFDSEKEMLEESFKLIESYPIVLTYNGDVFDMPYLYNRAINLGIDYIPFKMMKRNATLNLGIHIDLYGVFSNRSLKTYAFNAKYVEEGLDSVSKAMLGESKIDIKIQEVPLNLLAKYCYNDSRLTYKLSSFNNNLVMNLLIMLCRLGNMPIDDISRMSISHWIKSMLYFEHRQNNELIPRSDDFPKVEASTKAEIEGKKYHGAIVLEPKKGIHFDVTVLDFASLYTSLVKNHNISYETVCCPHLECRSNKIPQTKHWACTKKSGILALMLGSLKELRVNHFKKLWRAAKNDEDKEKYDTITQALKVYLNASYGVIGFASFPLYFLPTAEAITALAREVLSKTIEYGEEKDMTVIAGDTDSMFVKKPTKEQTQLLIDYVRDNYSMDLEVDKEYRYVMFSERKKNYFGVKKDGKLDIKGLTGKKSHTPPFLKKLFTEITDELKGIEKPEHFIPAKQTIFNKIKKCYTNFDSIPLEDLAFRIMINQEPSEYKTKPPALQAAEQLPTKPQKGQFVSFIKTWNKPKYRPIQLVKRKDINKEKYIETLESTLEQVTEPMEIDIDLALGRGRATTMDSYL